MNRNKVFIILLILIIAFTKCSMVYGDEIDEINDIIKKSYDLGYEDGKREGARNFKDTPYYKVMPDKDRILLGFQWEYGSIYAAKYDGIIINNYENGFEKGYVSTVRDSKEDTVEILNYSRTLGRSWGEIYAYRDYFDGKKSNWSRAMPTTRQLREMFNLDMETSQYRSAFFEIFRDNFEEAYNLAYEKANLEPIAVSYNQGINDGKLIGKMKGEYEALIDMTLSKSNSWTRHKVRDSVIIDEYGLEFQSDSYQRAFIIGYWEEFMRTYDANYNRLHLEQNKVKTYTERVSIDGKINICIPGDDKFFLDIDAGTYYNDIVVTIDSIPNIYIDANSDRHVQASGAYGLKVLNIANTFDNTKKLTIRFKSYGDDNKYGIYKYHYNQWVYIPSRQDGNYISADINLNNIDSYGNIYVVRVDNKLPLLYDARGHWAKEEINTYVKREIIYGYPDSTFKPDNKILRKEFVTMLSRLYNWFPPYDSTNIYRFKDFGQFGYAEKPISYAVYYGIVNGYPDGTFRPNNPITYREVEYIMAKVLNDVSFRWDVYADKMLYEYGVRSKSKDNMNNFITRAEFVFMLHRLNEAQY